MYPIILYTLLIYTLLGLGFLIYRYKKTLYNTHYLQSFKKNYRATRVPLIKLQIGDHFYYFLLDTGATSNILNLDAFERLPMHLKNNVFTSNNSVLGLGDNTKAKNQKLGLTLDLEHNGYKFSDTLFIIMDLSAPFSVIQSDLDGPILGLLGTQFLEKYKWIINFNDLTIWLKRKKKLRYLF